MKNTLRPINHVNFVIDESGSMKNYRYVVPRVFDEQIKTLADESVRLQQETRVSLYVFNGKRGIRCVAYDCDVLRLPSIAGHYDPDGGTPLIDATLQAILESSQTPQLHADHAFLLYVITDGEESSPGRSNHRLLQQRLDMLPENWTVCALVPDHRGVSFCRDLGFAPGNIVQWDATSETGVEAANVTMKAATSQYMTLRSQGVRSSKALFTPQVAGGRKTVLSHLQPVGDLYAVYKAKGIGKESIESFVIRATKAPYVVGSAYYELVKKETLQANKKICLRTKPDGRLYSGSLEQVRAVLGLPAGGEIKIGPSELKDFQVFIQSTSVNRNVIPNQEILVVKL